MITFWTFLYIVILLMVSIFLPYALFFYETDEDNSMKKRLLTALCYTVGAIIVVVMLLFISWAGLKHVSIPYTSLTVNFDQGVNSNSVVTPLTPISTEK
jgi:LMBR1 domain-containing protein 1